MVELAVGIRDAREDVGAKDTFSVPGDLRLGEVCAVQLYSYHHVATR
jgi:hypothetical protein